jgi:hypothetical protein
MMGKDSDKGHGYSWNQAHGRRDGDSREGSQADRDRERNIGHPDAEEHNRSTSRGGQRKP